MVLSSGLLTSLWIRVPSRLCAWNSSMLLAFSGHLSSGCHSGNLIASNKKSSALPRDFHGRAESRLWSGLGPNPDTFVGAMGEIFLLSRPTLYADFGSLNQTGQSQPNRNTNSQWVEKAISRKIFAGFRAEWIVTGQNSSVHPCACQTVSSQTNKQANKINKNRQTKNPIKQITNKRRRVCFLKVKYPGAVFHLFKHLAL